MDFYFLQLLIVFIGLTAIAIPFSSNIKEINYKNIIIGILFQIVLAFILIKIPIIVTFFNRNCINPNSQPTLISMELLYKILENTSNDGTFDVSILLKSTSFKTSYSRFPVKFLKRKIGFGANQTFFQKLKYAFKLLFFLWSMRRYSKLFNAK